VRLFCGALIALAAAGIAASPSASDSTWRASFTVTLRATIQQTASYKRQTRQGDCQYVYSGHWKNTLRIRSSRPTRMAVTSSSERLRFSPAVISALRGTFVTSGAGVAQAPGCEKIVTDCPPRTEKFRGGRTRVSSPRPGILTLGRLRRPALGRVCGTAGSIGGTRAGLELAVARLSAAQLIQAGRRPVDVTSSYTENEQLEPPKVTSGALTTHVAWRLVFTRVR
jgi:hypothetical protein